MTIVLLCTCSNPNSPSEITGLLFLGLGYKALRGSLSVQFYNIVLTGLCPSTTDEELLVSLGNANTK